MIRRTLPAAVAVAMLVSCNKPPESTPASAVPARPAPVAKAGDTFSESVVKTLDTKADPCVDFYRYACGGWLDTFQLPSDKVSYTRSFSSIDESNEKLLHDTLEAAAKADPPSDPDQKRIGDLYGSCMDTGTIDTIGVMPLKGTLTKIDAITDLKGVMHVTGELDAMGASPFIGMWVEGDFKDPGTNILHVAQAGLGMPDRDYYLGDGDDAQKLRDQYVATMEKMLTMAGVADAGAKSKKVYAFELELAKVQKPQEDLRDPVKTYNKIDLAGMQAKAPNMPFTELFAGVGAPGITTINVTDPAYIESMGKIVDATDLATLKDYLTWQYLIAAAPLLGKDWVDTDFGFFRQALVGQKVDRERWKKCVDYTTEGFGEIVGKYYVEQAFAGESKAVAVDLIARIAKSFESNLPGLKWMDDGTRTRAAEKLSMVDHKIGYPDKWRDYSAVSTSKGDFYGDVVATRAFETRRQLDMVGKPVDRSLWYMNASEVNAYYDPLKNEIVFPAGILQPPFFDKSYPQAANYGAIGMVMGHEFTHGFDDQGAQFDGHGKMTDWWDPSAVEKFKVQTKCVSDQYSGYAINDTLKVNGELTLGENIADAGGIKESFGAYQSWKGEHGGKEDTRIENVSDDQLFFIAFAQGWCSIRTPEIDKLYATVDPHSPPRFRVNGPLSQFPEFQKAFACPAGSPMAPTSRCEVW